MAKPYIFSDEELQQAVNKSKNIAEICQNLNLPKTQHVKEKIRLRLQKNPNIKVKDNIKYRQPKPEMLFIANTAYGLRTVRDYYLKIVDKYECKNCQLNEWNGKHLTLILNYKNNNKKDARLENLELLCPNCFNLLKKQYAKDYDKRLDIINKVINQCETFSEVAKKANMEIVTVRRIVRKNNINIDHFSKISKKHQQKSKDTNSDNHNAVKLRFLKNNPYECYLCKNNGVWLNGNIVFILDHKNGNSKDHNPQNLQLVCPNCNLQLDTHGMRNHKFKQSLKEKAQSE